MIVDLLYARIRLASRYPVGTNNGITYGLPDDSQQNFMQNHGWNSLACSVLHTDPCRIVVNLNNMTVEKTISNYEKVGEFHTVFEHPIKSHPDVSVFDENPKLVNLRYALIDEEVKEFIEATDNKDVVEMIDALADIDYVVHGAGLAFGINMDTMLRLAKLPENHTRSGKAGDFFERTSSEEVSNICDAFRGLLVSLRAAFDDRNIMDIAVVFLEIVEKTYEVAALMDVDLDEAFGLVHQSNMTKACFDEQQAQETLEQYRKDLSVYKEPAIKPSADGKYWIVYDKSTGKTLKSKYYKAVDLKKFAQV